MDNNKEMYMIYIIETGMYTKEGTPTYKIGRAKNTINKLRSRYITSYPEMRMVKIYESDNYKQDEIDIKWELRGYLIAGELFAGNIKKIKKICRNIINREKLDDETISLNKEKRKRIIKKESGKKFVCDLCDKDFATRAELTRHLNRKYSCTKSENILLGDILKNIKKRLSNVEDVVKRLTVIEKIFKKIKN
jgi:hypothetical protein